MNTLPASTESQPGGKPPAGEVSRFVRAAVVLLIIPAATFAVLRWFPLEGTPLAVTRGGSTFPPPPIPFEKSTIGPEPETPDWITNVVVHDLDRDGLPDVIACDARRNCVWWYRQTAADVWEEFQLADEILAPAHATVVDLDGDGLLDVIVSELGSIWPDDGVLGRVTLLHNRGETFQRRILLDDVRRVCDVQAGDLNGDGLPDLVVAVFGYARGEILWLENLGDLRFRDHLVVSAPGTIHVPLADYNLDGRLDVAAVVSQDEEEVLCFENQGDGKFLPRRIWFTHNFDLGSAGLVAADLDQDGKMDLLLPVGDNLEDLHSYPQPYHGCFWLRNLGDWNFEARRIATFGGTYAAAAGDVDGDGHLDVVLASMFNDWDAPGHASVVWLRNDGEQNFQSFQIDDRPTHLVTITCGDLGNRGRDDILTGGLHLTGPFDRLGRLTRWRMPKGPSP